MTDWETALPADYFAHLSAIVSESDLPACLDYIQQPGRIGARVNTLKAEIETTLEQLRNDGLDIQRFSEYNAAFSVPQAQRSQLTHHPLCIEGKVYVQNLSSMLPALLLNPQPDDRILDLTAAPGSKTSLLAALMNNQGWISAVEMSRPRFFRLRQNMAQQGASNVHFYNKDGAGVWRVCPEEFDRVLIDAPCSSDAQFSLNDPESMRYWSRKKVREMAKKQARLLYSAINCLRPGGTLVYSTCTYSPEENEVTVNKALRRFAGILQIEAVNLSLANVRPGLTHWNRKALHPDLARAVRLVPEHGMEAFFVCVMRKLKSSIS